MPADRYFFDVPVYRLVEEKYYSDQNRFVEGILFPPDDPNSENRRKKERENPSVHAGARDRLGQSYGGCWRYNEIIGYIRLHLLGSQIRGEYFSVTKTRVVRTRKKVLEYQTHKLAPEIDIPATATSSDIYELVIEYVNRCKREIKERFIDSELLEFVGQYVNWQKLYADHIARLNERTDQRK